MRTRLIFNPASGRARRNQRLLGRIREIAASPASDAELCVTEGPGHATVLAREAAAAGRERVIAVGGDGTLNEVAQGLLHTPAALGLVPCGSGNGLARHLGLPTSPAGALELLFAGKLAAIPLDAGLADGHPFFNVMGLGLDAEVSRRFNTLTRRGPAAYLHTVLAAYRHCVGARFTIDDGRQRENLPALLIAVANSDQYGNNARIAPGARADDGLLDLVTLPPVGLLGAAVIAARLFLGTIDRAPGVRHWRAARFRIERAGPGLLHTDGEIHPAGPTVEVAVLSQALRVLVPLDSLARRAGPAPTPPAPRPVAAASSFALKL